MMLTRLAVFLPLVRAQGDLSAELRILTGGNGSNVTKGDDAVNPVDKDDDAPVTNGTNETEITTEIFALPATMKLPSSQSSVVYSFFKVMEETPKIQAESKKNIAAVLAKSLEGFVVDDISGKIKFTPELALACDTQPTDDQTVAGEAFYACKRRLEDKSVKFDQGITVAAPADRPYAKKIAATGGKTSLAAEVMVALEKGAKELAAGTVSAVQAIPKDEWEQRLMGYGVNAEDAKTMGSSAESMTAADVDVDAANIKNVAEDGTVKKDMKQAKAENKAGGIKSPGSTSTSGALTMRLVSSIASVAVACALF